MTLGLKMFVVVGGNCQPPYCSSWYFCTNCEVS